MKTITKLGLMVALAGSLFLSSCYGSYYVTDQPAEPVYVRPVSPYAGAVWIDGDWAWSGGRYTYNRGYWARPRAGHVYMRGGWARGRRGYAWHRGHWR
jgi:hypothetical protein